MELERKARNIKLQSEEDLTKLTEKYIAMEKKYLVKENESIKLLAQI